MLINITVGSAKPPCSRTIRTRENIVGVHRTLRRHL
jgi:hypothetical protein